MRQSAWLLVSGALKPPDQAPSPTCPFIKNQQCQRAADSKSGQRLVPRFTPGDRLSEFRGDRSLRGRSETVSAASVEPIYAWFGIRSTAFCNFISQSCNPTENQRVGIRFAPPNPRMETNQTGNHPGESPIQPLFGPESGLPGLPPACGRFLAPPSATKPPSTASSHASFAIGALLHPMICSPLTALWPSRPTGRRKWMG